MNIRAQSSLCQHYCDQDPFFVERRPILCKNKWLLIFTSNWGWKIPLVAPSGTPIWTGFRVQMRALAAKRRANSPRSVSIQAVGTNDILPPRTCVATDCTTSGASAGGRRTKRRTLGVGMEMTCICVSIV